MIFILPLIFTTIIALLTTYLLYNQTKNKFHDIYINNTKGYSDVHVEQIIDNKQLEETIIETINEKLLTASKEASLTDVSLITDEYLNELVLKYNITKILLFNNDGLVIKDSEQKYYTYEPVENDPLYNYINSNLDEHNEFRKSLNEDKYYMYTYKRIDENYFIQASIEADSIYKLTNKYSYENILKKYYY